MAIQQPKNHPTPIDPSTAVSSSPNRRDLSPSEPSDGAPTPAPATPSLLRRLAAMLYDSVLLLGVLMLALLCLIMPYEVISGHPYPQDQVLYQLLKQIYLALVIAAFYVYFWTHGGQTLGMRTWRLRLVRADGSPLALKDALRRLAWAMLGLLPAGLGLWWCLLDPDGLAWYDRRSGTRLVKVG